MMLADLREGFGMRCLMTLEEGLGLFPELFKIGACGELLLHENLLSVNRLFPHRRLKEDSRCEYRCLQQVGLALSADWMRPERCHDANCSPARESRQV